MDWRERLTEGEFTPENQAKLKADQEKEKSKLDPWKVTAFYYVKTIIIFICSLLKSVINYGIIFRSLL